MDRPPLSTCSECHRDKIVAWKYKYIKRVKPQIGRLCWVCWIELEKQGKVLERKDPRGFHLRKI